LKDTTSTHSDMRITTPYRKATALPSFGYYILEKEILETKSATALVIFIHEFLNSLIQYFSIDYFCRYDAFSFKIHSNSIAGKLYTPHPGHIRSAGCMWGNSDVSQF